MYVLDTDHMSLLEWTSAAGQQRLMERLSKADATQVATTIITFEEQTRGWLAYLARAKTMVQQVEAYRRLNRQIENYRRIRILDFDERAAVKFQGLVKSRLRIGTMDLKIAAIVLSRNAILLSSNLADFGLVPGLRVENWAR